MAPAAPPVRPIVIGVIAALVVVALVVAVFVLGGTPAASPAPSSTPAVSIAPSTSVTQSAPAAPTTAPILTDAPTTAPIETAPPEATPAASAGQTASTKPVVDSLKGPRSASCTTTNGTALPGYVKLSWTASNTTGVRLSIDPPAPNNAYDYPYADYPAVGSAEVPFACDPPNTDGSGAYHLYVVTTIHDKGYFAYRFIKIYVKA